MTWAGALALLRRYWWAVPIAGLLIWALVLRGDVATARAALVAEQAAHQQSIANWNAAAASAQILDLQNKQFVEAQQAAETRRISDDYEARLADARARAAVSVRPQAAPADQGGRGAAAVPGVPDPARIADAAACQGGLPPSDALIATEQAIQLDELINWVEAQARIPVNAKDVDHD